MFEAFQESDYRRFWTAQFISNVGSWMQFVAQGWLVYRLTDSPFLLGLVGFAGSAPAVVLMLPGGLVADHFDRKRVVAVSQLAQAGCALFLAASIALKTITVWQIIAAAVVVGIAQSFSAPAFQAMIVDLLEDRSRLPNAIAMNSLQFNSSRLLGPLLAGAALSAWGSLWCFLLNGLSFLPLAWVLMRLRKRQVALDTSTALLERFAEGFRFVRGDRLVLVLLGVVAASSAFVYPLMNLMPVVARAVFANEAAGLGYLMGAVGLGALIAALGLSMRTPNEERARLLIAGSLVVSGVALAAVGTLRSRPSVLALLFLIGGSMVLGMALCNTTIQRRLPDAIRGRVLSMYTFAFFAAVPIGNLLAGTLAERRGIGTTLLTLGGAVVAAGLVAGGVMGRTRAEFRVPSGECRVPSSGSGVS